MFSQRVVKEDLLETASDPEITERWGRDFGECSAQIVNKHRHGTQTRQITETAGTLQNKTKQKLNKQGWPMQIYNRVKVLCLWEIHFISNPLEKVLILYCFGCAVYIYTRCGTFNWQWQDGMTPCGKSLSFAFGFKYIGSSLQAFVWKESPTITSVRFYLVKGLSAYGSIILCPQVELYHTFAVSPAYVNRPAPLSANTPARHFPSVERREKIGFYNKHNQRASEITHPLQIPSSTAINSACIRNYKKTERLTRHWKESSPSHHFV